MIPQTRLPLFLLITETVEVPRLWGRPGKRANDRGQDRVRHATASCGRFFDADQCSVTIRIEFKIASEEAVDSRVLEGANFHHDQVGVRRVRKPALRRRLLRLTSLIVIALVSIGLWIAAIWTAFAMLGAGA